ncbi:MAG: ATP-dependent 6-phosphofructokinase [Nanoarchaeota archaeon]|nr:ATP-dependent 6-phosphofructokinase [Nanoarchaeota archaeon]
MRIGILTGGGDVPGLNTVLRDVVYRAQREKDINILGIKRGWGGLIYMNPDNQEMDPEHAIPLNEISVRGYDRVGGTRLHTSRIQPSKVNCDEKLRKYRGLDFECKRDMTQDVIKNLQNLGIDKLIAIGGDDTLSYALHLHKQGIPIIAIPKTMDGDVMGTDYCIGFNTAIVKATTYVTELRTHMGSHERIGIIEVFGRHSGFTGLYTALAAKSDRVIIPEVEFDIQKLSDILASDKKDSPSNYSVLIVSEGAKPLGGKETIINGKIDNYGHIKLGGIGEQIAEKIQQLTGEETMTDNLRYLLRSGPPTAKDKIVASTFANIAMDAALRGDSGKMTAVRNGKFCLVPLEETKSSPAKVDVARQYNSERYEPNYVGLEGTIVLL